MKTLLIAIAGMAAISAPASAAPIVGSFSLTSFSGTYIGGTAATATGLDFGSAFDDTGNGYGVNGTALIGNAKGSFAGLSGLTASIADISLGVTANPYTTNPFISFGTASNIVFNFSNAVLTRSPLGTSISIAGQGTFSNGNAADTTTGMFTLSTASQEGMASNVNFTFTSNVSAAAVPEPATWALMILGMGAVGFAMRRRNTTTRVRFA